MKSSAIGLLIGLTLNVSFLKVSSQTSFYVNYYDTIVELHSLIRGFPSNDNFIFSNSDYKWKPKTSLTFLDYGLQSGCFSMNANMLSLNHRFFNISTLSVFQNDEIDSRDAYFYFLPIGLKFPLFSSKYSTLSLGSTFFIFPSENAINANNNGKYYKFSRFIDVQLKFETNFVLGADIILGNRFQLSGFSISDQHGEVIYTGNSVSGAYVGITFKLEVIFPPKPSYWGRCFNPGKDEFYRVIRINTVKKYEELLNKYPVGPYAEIGRENLNKLRSLDSIRIGNIRKSVSLLIPGIGVDEVIKILQMESIFNSKRSFYSSLGILSHQNNEKSQYTGKLNLDGFNMEFRDGNMVSVEIIESLIGSRRLEFRFID